MALRDPIELRAVLGIDAAWTHTNPSGVALVVEGPQARWRCVAVAPSYREFVAGEDHANVADALLPIDALVAAARKRAGRADLCVVAVDIPLSRHPITGRRCSDITVSKHFGARGCSTHSPSARRPGPISAALRDGFARAGFTLTTGDGETSAGALIETYPHPALLELLGLDYRFEYKVSRSRQYWPGMTLQQRIHALLANFRRLRAALDSRITDIDLIVPEHSDTLAALKPLEDQLDALVCAWVGLQYLHGQAEPYGDHDSAIWLPTMTPRPASR